MQPVLEETVTIDFILSDPDGAAVDADSTPSAEAFEDTSDVAILAPAVVKRSGKTGNYRVAVPCLTANGFEVDRSYNLIVSATVGGVAAKACLATFQLRPAVVSATLVPTGLDAIPTTQPIGVATNFREMVVQTWRRFFKRAVLDKNTGLLKTYADNASTVLTSQSVTSTTEIETQSTAT